jgi:TolB-like protein
LENISGVWKSPKKLPASPECLNQNRIARMRTELTRPKHERAGRVYASVSQLNGPGDDYFVDAATGALRTDLSRLAGAMVIVRATLFIYKGNPVGARESGGNPAFAIFW